MLQVEVLAKLSRCCRRQFGAMIIDPKRLQVLTDGYNGPPRGSKGDLCGGATCDRTTKCVESGTHPDIGCFHAEQNAILNAANRGTALADSWLFVQGEPCIGCARNIYHAGIAGVVIRGGGYTTDEGVNFLRENGVQVRYAPVGNKIGVIASSSLFGERNVNNPHMHGIAKAISQIMEANAPTRLVWSFFNNEGVMSVDNVVFVSKEDWLNQRDPLTAVLRLTRVPSMEGGTLHNYPAWETGTMFVNSLERDSQQQYDRIAQAAYKLLHNAGGMLF